MFRKSTAFTLIGIVALALALLPEKVSSAVFPGISLYGRFNSAAKALTATTDGYLNVKVVSGATPTFESLTLTKDGLVTTTAIGLKIQSTTAATAGVPVQVSPAEQLCGTAWKSNVTAASQVDCWQIYNVPATDASVTTETLKWQASINGGAYNNVMTLTSGGVLELSLAASEARIFAAVSGSDTSYMLLQGSSGSQVYLGSARGGSGTQPSVNIGPTQNVGTPATNILANGSTAWSVSSVGALTGELAGAGITKYKSVATAGWGIPATYGYGDVVAATNTGTASIAAYTVGAADGTFEVGCNVLVTTSTSHSFSCDVTYTDEGNTARTLVLPVAQLAGSFVTSGLITNATGAGPYESPTMTIRAKAATAITVRTSAGGTYTTVIYNARGIIKQVG